MAQCLACGNPLPHGILTCQRCGKTCWTPIAVWFTAALAVKAMAVCGGLWLENLWLNSLMAWGGSVVAAFFLLGVIGCVFDAYRWRGIGGRASPIPGQAPVLKARAYSRVQGMLAGLISIVFILVGMPIGPFAILLYLWLGLSIVLVTLIEVPWAALWAGKRHLAARLVDKPEEWPAAPATPDGILLADSRAATTPAAPVEPVRPKPRQEAEVMLRVVYRGAWAAQGLNLAILLDGQLIGVGTLRGGCDARGVTTPGIHELGLKQARFPLPNGIPGGGRGDGLCPSRSPASE